MKKYIILLIVLSVLHFPSCSTFKPTPPSVSITPLTVALHEPRQNFTLTQVSEDAWLVAGGKFESDLSDKASDTAEMIHLISDQRIIVHPLEAKMLVKRWAHQATMLQNGNVFICGGSSDTQCEIFSVKERKFKLAGQLNQARSSHAQILLKNGKILITGGYHLSQFPRKTARFFSSAEIYDPETNRITSVDSMKVSRSGHAMVEFEDKIYIMGGDIPEASVIESYDQDSQKFTETTMRLPFALKEFQLYQIGSDVYLMGGKNPEGIFSNKILKINFLDKTVTVLSGKLQEPTEGISLCPPRNPYKVVVFGGRLHRKTELISLDPFEITPLKSEIDRMNAQVLPLPNGGCLAVGGTNSTGQPQLMLLRVDSI